MASAHMNPHVKCHYFIYIQAVVAPALDIIIRTVVKHYKTTQALTQFSSHHHLSPFRSSGRTHTHATSRVNLGSITMHHITRHSNINLVLGKLRTESSIQVLNFLEFIHVLGNIFFCTCVCVCVCVWNCKK